MKNTSSEIMTLMLLQEQRAELVAKGKALRQEMLVLENAVAHVDLAITSIKSSPLSGAVDAPSQALLGTNSVRPGVVTRLLTQLCSNHQK